METFGMMYRFECKKLWQRKIVRLSVFLSAALVVFGCFSNLIGDYVIDGEVLESNYEGEMKDYGYARDLNDRSIDQSLLTEMSEAYGKVPDTTMTGRHYTGTAEYQQYARPYSQIFQIVSRITGLQPLQIMYEWEVNENECYEMYGEYLEKYWENCFLTEEEKMFWREQSSRIEKPFVYREAFFCQGMLQNYQITGYLIQLLLAVCLAGMFAEEHTRRMDQLNLCAVNGLKRLYRAKVLAGITFAVIITGVLLTIQTATLLLLYGKGSFAAALQLFLPECAAPLTIGQAVVTAYGVVLVTELFYAVFVMLLSELTRSALASLAVAGGLLFAGIISIPGYWRTLSQFWDWQPFCILSQMRVFKPDTLGLFGQRFTVWQAVPVIYIIAGVIVVLLGKWAYERYQVSGR